MIHLRLKPLGLAAMLLAATAISAPAFAAGMPPSMGPILKKLNIDASVLKNSAKELAVPPA